jgi:translation initiation factor IF-3
LLRFANDLEDYGKVEQLPALEGKKMIIMLAPKKTGSSPKPVKPTEPKLIKTTELKIEDNKIEDNIEL